MSLALMAELEKSSSRCMPLLNNKSEYNKSKPENNIIGSIMAGQRLARAEWSWLVEQR